MVVVLAPVLDDALGIVQISEPMQVQTGVPESGVEGFHERILGRFARLNEMKLDAGILAPEEHRFAGHFRAVVHEQVRGQTTGLIQLL